MGYSHGWIFPINSRSSYVLSRSGTLVAVAQDQNPLAEPAHYACGLELPPNSRAHD